MKPDKLTVYELFQHEKRYVVPLYQRRYVWTREDQWEPLWGDIEAKAIAALQQRPVSPHFLGAVVLAQIPVGARQIAASQVIDGQQRLTTLQVFLSAFRDCVEQRLASVAESDVPDLQKTVNKLKALTLHGDVLGGQEERFKVWPTNEDRKEFVTVVTAGSSTGVEKTYPILREGGKKKKVIPGPLLVEAYRYFASVIAEYLDGDGDAASGSLVDRVVALLNAIQQKLLVVVIDLEIGDDPQIIFETLNDRGEPLLPSDLVRNLVFSRAAHKQEDGDALYMELWRPFDANAEDGTEGFWRRDVKQGRQFRKMLDLFLQHYLMSRQGGEVAISHLYEQFRDWWEKQDGRSVRDCLEELRRYAEVYQSFREPIRLAETDPRLERLLRTLNALDITTAYPLMLYLLVDAGNKLSRPERDAMLDALESFVVRRAICNVTTKNYNRIFAGAREALAAPEGMSAVTLRSYLASGSKDTRWPEDGEFMSSWLRVPVYERFDSTGIRVLLGAINQSLLGAKHEQVLIKGDLTVEHVMPQSWWEKWPMPVADRTSAEDNEESPTETRNRLIHTFGNLTLLTQPLNSSVRNEVFAVKRPEIARQSLLPLNTYFQTDMPWDEAAIIVRGKSLGQLAKTLWPRA